MPKHAGYELWIAAAGMKKIELALADIDFPAAKEAVVEHATARGADDDVQARARRPGIAEHMRDVDA